MSNTLNLKASGLHTFNNYLGSIPEGAQLEADNVNIDRDGVIEPRRGFVQYGTLPDVATQLLFYKNRLLANIGSSLYYDNGSGTFTDFSASFPPVGTSSFPIRMKGVELNGNFYVTTSDGVKKIAADSSDMSAATVTLAGGARALDISTATIDYSTSGFFTAFSQVAYRVVWGRKDVNDNLILGRPSSRFVITNSADRSGNVVLTIPIPEETQAGDFAQIYRSAVDSVATAGEIANLAANDELNQVYEYVLENESLTEFTITDIVPDTLRSGYTALYINQITGEGIQQANDLPPVCKDLAVYKNSVFFANTKSYHTMSASLIGVAGIEDSSFTVSSIGTGATSTVTTTANHGLNNGDKVVILGSNSTPSVDGKYAVSNVTAGTFDITPAAPVTIAGTVGSAYTASITTIHGSVTNEYFFVGRPEITSVTFPVPGSWASGDYFLLDAAEQSTKYYIYNGTDPLISGRVGILVDLTGDVTASDVAASVDAAVVAYTSDFVVSGTGANRIFTTANNGSTSINSGTKKPGSLFTISVTQEGFGEDTSNGYIRLSGYSLDSQQIDDTARSMIRVINANNADDVYARYISSDTDAPGNMSFELREFSDTAFAFACSRIDVKEMFNPYLPVVTTGTATYLSPTVTINSVGHNLVTGNTVYIFGQSSYFTVTKLTNDDFTIQSLTSITGTVRYAKIEAVSSNSIAANRLYFSKYQQPEAVPALNYLDIGPKDKAIKRIVALRDSLFVFKDDGIYRVTGNFAPNFSVQLFDTSAIITAPDAASVLNNQIYALTTQGVASVTETGVGIVSRAIEDIFTKINTSNYPYYNQASFAVGYESERSFLIFTVTKTSDTVATKVYRFNTFTQSWTTWTVTARCAAVGGDDNKLFIGPNDIDAIEAERKTLTRYDYSDRQYDIEVNKDTYNGEYFRASNVANIEKGDVLVQTQYLTASTLRRLAKKLYLDPGMPNANKAFYNAFEITESQSLSDKLKELADQIDTDLGTSYALGSYSAVFATLQTQFNDLIDLLNADTTLVFADYQHSVGTIKHETTVSAVNKSLNYVYGHPAALIAGAITVHKAIQTSVVWAPTAFGDASVLKHVREATLLFSQDNITFGAFGFNTDLSPGFEDIDFQLEGSGLWGDGWNTSTWGGDGTSVPFRTLVPRQKQRCRFIRARYKHRTAFDRFMILGLSFVFKPTSTRAYK